MTIDEAIKLLNIAKGGFPAANTEYYYRALELGLEALKEVKMARFDDPALVGELLPGETINY